MPFPKIVDAGQLESLGEECRRSALKIVWTNGCFDLLHVGHIRSLRAARELGDVLVVGINADETVRILKGPGRPLVPATERAEIIAALTSVDHVTIFDEATPEMCLWRLRPAIHCKGAEYGPLGGRAVPETAVVESYGGRVVFLPMMPGISTTALIRRLREGEDL